MSENEFEICGDLYVAADKSIVGGCNGCALLTRSYGCAANLFKDAEVPSCQAKRRTDGRNVIFVEAQDERAKG